MRKQQDRSCGNPVSSYVTNSGVYIILTDLIQNTNASTAQTVTVTVTNVSNGDAESVVLTETGTNTGIFRNTTPLPMSTTAGSTKFDSTLRALAGNFLSVTYTDPISGNSGSATVTTTAAPLPFTTKSSQLAVDQNGDGRIGWGDTIQYSILLTNTTAQAITNLVVRDTLPANVSYVTGSTTSNGVAVADSGATPFPLDETGLTVASLAASRSTLLTFQVTVTSGTSIANSVTVTNLNGLVQAQDVASVTPPPSSCNLSFTDGSGNPVSVCAENAGLYVTTTDSSQNTNPTNAQTVTVTLTNLSGGDVEALTLTETGTNTGVFRNTAALTTSTVLGTSQQNGTLNGRAGQVVSVYFTGAGGETCSASATFVPAVQTKKLYLSAVNAGDLYQNLDRIDPVAAGKTATSNSVTPGNGSSATFAQTPAFCSSFVLPAGSVVAITNYFSVLSGVMPASPAINATLKKGTNAATATAVLALSNPVTNSGYLRWSGNLFASVSVANGETIFLVVTSAQSGVTFAVQFNSSSKPSSISLPTTVISLDQLGVYDAPYPAGNLITNTIIGQTVFVRSPASDPFGAYDVTRLSLSVLDPGGYTLLTNLTAGSVVATTTCSRTYEFPWLTENWQGSYSILATAYEGTEGITNALQTALQVHYPPGGTPSTTTFIDNTGSPTNSYATNQSVCVRVQDQNLNQNPAAVETVSVVITTTSGDRETVVLSETGTNTGVFTGCIAANTNAAVQGSGVLNAPGGAGLTATYTDPLNPSDITSDSALVRMPPGPKPIVSLFKTLVAPANSTVLLGSTVQFNLEVDNPGSVTNVTLTDTFPSARLQFLSATIPPDSTAPAGTLTWNNRGPLQPGTNVIISAFFTAKMAGALTNSASVTGTTNVGPVTAAAINNVSAIAVTKTLVSPVPEPAYINSNVVFRIAITNTGVNPINSYLLQDQFSSACFQFLGASVAPSGSGGGVVLWASLPALAVGASTSIYVTNKVVGDCEPGINNANISSVLDQSGKAVPDAQSSASITNLGASISGTIWYDANANGTNDTGDSPLASVNVYVDLNGDGVRQGSEPFATTDTNGVYQIVNIPAGNYAARIDTNSLPAGVRPTFDFDGTNTPNAISLSISNGQVIADLEFGYIGSGSISGYLWSDVNGDGVKQAGEPGLSGINVYIDLNANGVREPGEPYVASGSDGSFAFNYLVANTYRVAIDLLSLPPDMRPTFDLDGTNSPNVATITLGAGQTVTNANFGYQGRASLAGVVTDAFTGLPIAAATVVVVDSQRNPQTLTTGLSGDYTVASLWTGPATLTVSKTGYRTVTATPAIVGGANTQNEVLTPNTLTGVVTDAVTTLPIAGATVQVTDSSNVVHTVTTDATGHYGVTNLPTGSTTLTASHTSYASVTSHPTIVPGPNTLNVALTPNTLAGVVTNTVSGLPIVGATVLVVDSANVTNTLTTDATGHYAVTNIAVGIAALTASKTGSTTATASPAIVVEVNTQSIGLTANTLTGGVTDAVTTLPIGGATIQVTDSSNVVHTVTTEATGHYGVTNLPAGPAILTASQTGYASATSHPTIVPGPNTLNEALTANMLAGVVTNSLTSLPIDGATVMVVDSANVTNTLTADATGHYAVTDIAAGAATITATKTCHSYAAASPTIIAGANTQDLGLTPNMLTGVVRDAVTSLPIAGATVVVIDGANVTNALTTAANGVYGMTNVPAGIVTVIARKTCYTVAIANPTIVTGVNIQDLRLTANTLTGQVTDAGTHQPIAGATVQVVDSAGTTNTVATDAMGHYTVTNLATGAAIVTATQTGYLPATTTPTIAAGPTTQDLQLTASTPTLALLSSVKAFVADKGVLVRWQTASEVGSVSFDLYRQGTSGDQWTKVNPEPVLAANAVAGATYEVVDHEAKAIETLVYRLVELEEQGTTRAYGSFTLRAEAAAPATPTPALAGQTASKSLKMAAQVKSSQSLAQGTTSVPLTALDGTRFVQITTTNSGIHSITAASLAGLLGQAPAAIQTAISGGSAPAVQPGRSRQLPAQCGWQCPVLLCRTVEEQLRRAKRLLAHHRHRRSHWVRGWPRAQDWIGTRRLGRSRFLPGGTGPRAGPAGCADPGAGSESGLLDVATPRGWPRDVRQHQLFSRVGSPVARWRHRRPTYPQAAGRQRSHAYGAGNPERDRGGPGYLAGPRASQHRPGALERATGGRDQSAQPQGAERRLGGYQPVVCEWVRAQLSAAVFCHRWHARVCGQQQRRNHGERLRGLRDRCPRHNGPEAPGSGAARHHHPNRRGLFGQLRAFGPAKPVHCLPERGWNARVLGVPVGQVAGRSNPANGADYIIIAPDSLADAASTLAAYRQQKGLRTAVVRLDQVYNEFSYGIPTPNAIKRLLATALSQWGVKPRYAVLIGNGTYDYRDLLQKHDNLMPPLLVGTGYGLFCSDSTYGDVNDDGQPEIAVGRLPVKTADQLLVLINKIKSYEGQPAVANAQSLLLADAPDTAGNFTDVIQQVGATLTGNYSNSVVQCSSQGNLGALRQGIQSSLNAGVDLVDYIGHGAIDRFGNAGYLTSADVATLQNGARLPLVVAVTCVSGQYSVPGSSCLARSLLLQSQGGAIAVVAPTGLSVNQDASRLNLRLMQLLRANAQAGISDMFRQAMADHVAQDNPATQPAIYNLLGDPATAYNVAPETASVIMAPRFTTMTASNGTMVITWSGGKPPYQLEKQSALLPGAPWEPLREPVTGTSTTVPLTGPAGFIRVRCAP